MLLVRSVDGPKKERGLSTGAGADNKRGLQPHLGQARQTAQIAHSVVIKLKVMGLPEGFDAELASLSTDLGDLWSAQKALADRMEGLLESADDWEAVGDLLVDLRAGVDHIAWHVKSVRKPLNRITHFAYRKALES